MEQEKPQYTEEELERYEKRGAKITDKGCLQSADEWLLIPENPQWKSFPKALELANHVTQLSAFQQALTELREMTPDPVWVEQASIWARNRGPDKNIGI